MAKPGGILILDASRKTHSQTSSLKNFTLWVPRSLLEPLISDPDALHGLIIPAEEPRAIILRTYLMSLHEQAPGMTVPQASTLTRPTIELLASTLDLNRDGLTPDSIAKALRISRATLYRVCAPLGGIHQYIRQQRLRRVLNNLVDKNLLHLSITQIASLWGFNDPSSFNRIFKREFGVTPSIVRNQKFSSLRQDVNTSPEALLVGDRQFAHWLTHQMI